MRFTVSREIEYGIRGLTALATAPNHTAPTKDIAAQSNIPLPFLTKIFRRLQQAGILHSLRGKGGGVSLARKPRQITLLDIMEALDTPVCFCDCQSQDCGQKASTCGLKKTWLKAEKVLAKVFSQTKLSDLI